MYAIGLVNLVKINVADIVKQRFSVLSLHLVSARKVTHLFHQIIFRVHPGYRVPNRTNLKNARYSVILLWLWRQLNLVITKGLYYPSTYLVKMWQIIEFVMLGTTFELFLLLFILLTISSLYSSSTESGNAISVAWRWSCGTTPIECALFTFTFSLWIGHIWTITWRGCPSSSWISTNEIREVAGNLIALHCPVLRVPAMTWHAAWNTSQQNICSVWGCETQTQKQLNPSMIPHCVLQRGAQREGMVLLSQPEIAINKLDFRQPPIN